MKQQVKVHHTSGNGGGNGNGKSAGLQLVKLDVFEGPLDLLLYLIRKDEINIYDIPIARITEEYLGYLHVMESLDLEIAGEYLVVAATLIRIKSSMLLPRDPENEEEEDPRDELVRALLEYRKFKYASEHLRSHEDDNRGRYGRSDLVPPAKVTRTEYVNDYTLFDLLTAFKDVLDRVEEDVYCEVAVDDVTVEDRIAAVEGLLVEGNGIRFADLFDDNPTRAIVVMTFIALLELLKMGRIGLRQNEPFADIWVHPLAA